MADPATLGAPELLPSLVGTAVRLAIGVVVLSAAAGAWLYWHRRLRPPSRQLEVLDRAMLARGASVALLRVCDRRLLVGVSPEGVRLIRDLEPADALVPGHSFADVLTDAGLEEERR